MKFKRFLETPTLTQFGEVFLAKKLIGKNKFMHCELNQGMDMMTFVKQKS